MGLDIKKVAIGEYKTAAEKGFWENPDFIRCLCLIHSEVTEALNEIRDNKPIQLIYSDNEGKPHGVPIELADIILRVLSLTEHYGIDIEQAILIKQVFNKTRGYKHGGKAF